MLIENILHSKEYWNLVENGSRKPIEEITLIEAKRNHIDDQKLKDLKAKNYLFQALHHSVLE